MGLILGSIKKSKLIEMVKVEDNKLLINLSNSSKGQTEIYFGKINGWRGWIINDSAVLNSCIDVVDLSSPNAIVGLLNKELKRIYKILGQQGMYVEVALIQEALKTLGDEFKVELLNVFQQSFCKDYAKVRFNASILLDHNLFEVISK